MTDDTTPAREAIVRRYSGLARLAMTGAGPVPLPDRQVDVVISNCVINLSTDKPAVLAEAVRVLRPGGRLGVSDVIAGSDRQTAADRQAGGRAGTLTANQYRGLLLLRAGFTTTTITLTGEAGPGLHSTIIQATTPSAPDGVAIRPMRADDAEQVLPSTRPAWTADTPVSRPPPPPGRSSTRSSSPGTATSPSTSAGVWTIQSGIFPENTASLALHERCGFRVIGTRRRIAKHHGAWRDVVLIERRSPAIA